MRVSPLLTLAVVLAGCTSARDPIEVSDPAGTGEEVDLSTGELTLLSRIPRPDASALGGPNKPNGVEYRYRRWVPAETPAYVPRRIDSLDLAIADDTPDGWLAFYESPGRGLGPNRAYRAVLFGPSGNRVWDVDLNPFFPRPDQLEIQDIRYEDGHLYFNMACQTYAREADGQCSSLVSIDPPRGTVDWVTPPRTSNDIFVFYGPYVVSGYGFTNEPDSLYLVDRTSGDIVEREPLDSAHDYLDIDDRTLRVVTYESVYRFQMPQLTAGMDYIERVH